MTEICADNTKHFHKPNNLEVQAKYEKALLSLERKSTGNISLQIPTKILE